MFELPYQFTHYFMIFKWAELLEVGVFVSCFYFFAKWLNNDKSKKLILLFTIYWSTFFASDLLELKTLNSFMLYFSPLFLMLFILAHQNLIQRNFVTIKNIKPAKLKSLDWIEDIVKSLVYSVNKNISVLCIIENEDKLDNFVSCKVQVDCFLNKNLLNAIFSSPEFNSKEIVYLTKSGILKGFNSEIQDMETSLDNMQNNASKALILSSQTDCVYIKASHESRTFDVSIQGKILNRISSANLLTVLKEYYDVRMEVRNSSNRSFTKPIRTLRQAQGERAKNRSW